MVQLTPASRPTARELYAKLEMANPGGSVKDRIGVAMIEAAEAEGRIEPGRTTIVEATSGNTGIALAFVCAARGYDLVLTLPQGMSREREGLLRLYGAQRPGHRVARRDERGRRGRPGARPRRRRVAARPVLQPRQPGDAPAHDRAGDLGGARRPASTVSSAGVGTGGTITGVGRLPQGAQPGRCRSIAVEPQPRRCCRGGAPGPHKIQGIGAGFVPAGARPRRCSTRSSRSTTRTRSRPRARGARREGVLCGISLRRRAVGRARGRRARRRRAGKRIVIVLPDSGERYVSTPFFAPEPARAGA